MSRRTIAVLEALCVLVLLTPLVERVCADEPAKSAVPFEIRIPSIQLVGHTEAEGDRHQSSAPPLSVTTLKPGCSTKELRADALRKLPLDLLSAEDRARASQVIRSLSLFRQLPTLQFDVRPEVYSFFVTHPDVAVSIWRALDISTFQMWQTGETSYEVKCDDGSVGILELLHQDASQSLILCKGSYNNALLVKPIEAIALMHLQTRYLPKEEGRQRAVHNANLFVAFPSQAVETAAKVISPISYMIADRNFREISLFVQMMSMAMEHQPGWVDRLTDRMDGVMDSRKEALREATARVYGVARNERLTAALEVGADHAGHSLAPSPIHVGPQTRPLRPRDSVRLPPSPTPRTRTAPVPRVSTAPHPSKN